MYKRTIYDYRERINKARDIAMKKSNRKLLSMGGFIEKITLRRIVASTFRSSLFFGVNLIYL